MTNNRIAILDVLTPFKNGEISLTEAANRLEGISITPTIRNQLIRWYKYNTGLPHAVERLKELENILDGKEYDCI